MELDDMAAYTQQDINADSIDDEEITCIQMFEPTNTYNNDGVNKLVT